MCLVDNPAVILVLAVARISRVLRTLDRTQQSFPNSELIVVAPAVQIDEFRRSGWTSVVAGERWLRLDDPRLDRWLNGHRGITVVIPLAWPRSALRFVSRFIRNHPQEQYLVDWPLGLQTWKISHGAICGFLWVSSWVLWAPRYVIVRFMQLLDGLFMYR